MIAHLLAAAASAASGASTGSTIKLHVPPIRYLSILPPIIMIGGAVLLLALASLVSRPLRVRVATIGTVGDRRDRRGDLHLAVVRCAGSRCRTPTSPTRS